MWHSVDVGMESRHRRFVRIDFYLRFLRDKLSSMRKSPMKGNRRGVVNNSKSINSRRHVCAQVIARSETCDSRAHRGATRAY